VSENNQTNDRRAYLRDECEGRVVDLRRGLKNTNRETGDESEDENWR
jgi:hypothetical protein